MTTANATHQLNIPALLHDRRGLLSRIAFRLPLVLYRLGVGWVLGNEFLVLTHVGRRTRRVRETVLKVLHYDPSTGECIVASAWGRHADWYQNIQTRPALAVQTGRQRYVPEQRGVGADEAFSVFKDWTGRQRWFARLMLGQIGQRLDVPEGQLRATVESFPFVAFRPMPVERNVQGNDSIRSEESPNDDRHACAGTVAAL